MCGIISEIRRQRQYKAACKAAGYARQEKIRAREKRLEDAIQRRTGREREKAEKLETDRRNAELEYYVLVDRLQNIAQRECDLWKISSTIPAPDNKPRYLHPSDPKPVYSIDTNLYKARLSMDKQFESLQRDRFNVVKRLNSIAHLLSADKQQKISELYDDVTRHFK